MNFPSIPSAKSSVEQSNAIVGIYSGPRENQIDFICSNCKLSLKCYYGRLEFEKARYEEECYYMRNPFEPPNIHKAQRDYTIDDFVVVGSKCSICEQLICVDEECSLFYKNTYCLKCVLRERHSFPIELINQILRQQKTICPSTTKCE